MHQNDGESGQTVISWALLAAMLACVVWGSVNSLMEKAVLPYEAAERAMTGEVPAEEQKEPDPPYEYELQAQACASNLSGLHPNARYVYISAPALFAATPYSAVNVPFTDVLQLSSPEATAAFFVERFNTHIPAFLSAWPLASVPYARNLGGGVVAVRAEEPFTLGTPGGAAPEMCLNGSAVKVSD
ncbi:hypothetical protein ACSHT0_08045 [Tepidicaulis sp. LMO-SS28]|uniref:hypothetical protein n=1 Tax=Tepidicaulis sp. LMO-SS28 TaxID=3447455 RepID=UPI003EE0876F